jgi:Tfp pilus assembly protein PilV
MAHRLRLLSSDRPRDGEAGFALIEVIVSAAVLAMVALAVLAGVDAAGRSTGREKARSVAVGLAEQDQERLHAMPAEDVEGAASPPSATLNGATYTITSSVDWVDDATGGTPSCTNDKVQASYLRITSKVTSPALSQPVVVSSLVEPPISKSGAGQGSLAVQVLDRLGQPVESVAVTTSNGPDPAETETTNAAGCAIFGKVGAGNYDLSLSKTGYVDDHGRGPGQGASGTATVDNQVANIVTLRYDRAAPWTFSFVTSDLTTAAANDTIASKADAIAASNSQVNDLLTWTIGSEGSSIAANLFPFTAAYNVYGGRCDTADPLTAVADTYYTDNPTLGGQVAAQPATPGSANILLPPLRVRAVSATSPTGGTGMSGATIKITTADCGGDSWSWPVLSSGTSTRGYASRSTSTTSYDAGLPYGTYSVCAQAPISTDSNQVHKSGWLNVTLSDPYVGIPGSAPVQLLVPTATSARGNC